MNPSEPYCEQVSADPIAVVDGTADAALLCHAGSCPRCARTVEEVRTTLGMLSVWRVAPLADPARLVRQTLQRTARAARLDRVVRRAAAVLVFALTWFAGNAASPQIEREVAGPDLPRCEDHLRTLGLAVQRYAIDHGVFPPLSPAGMASTLLEGGYVLDPRVFSCPEAKPSTGATDYVAVGITSAPAPGGPRHPLPILADRVGNHEGYVHVYFPGGRIDTIPDRLLGWYLAERREGP